MEDYDTGTMSECRKESSLCGDYVGYLSRMATKLHRLNRRIWHWNSFITDKGLEMGRAQVVQAEAAGIEPEVSMNPILLKPTNDVGSQDNCKW